MARMCQNVGVSPYELYAQGNIDAIVDFSPADGLEQLENLRLALIHNIMNVESRTRNLWQRIPVDLLKFDALLSSRLTVTGNASSASLALTRNLEYLNVFGVAVPLSAIPAGA